MPEMYEYTMGKHQHELEACSFLGNSIKCFKLKFNLGEKEKQPRIKNPFQKHLLKVTWWHYIAEF